MDWNWEGGFGCPAGLWSTDFTVRGSCDQQVTTVRGSCVKETSMYIRQDQCLRSVYRCKPEHLHIWIQAISTCINFLWIQAISTCINFLLDFAPI